MASAVKKYEYRGQATVPLPYHHLSLLSCSLLSSHSPLSTATTASSSSQRPGLPNQCATTDRCCIVCCVCVCSVPRSFRLRQELEYAEKGSAMESKSSSSPAAAKPKDPHAMFVSFGLGELDDMAYDNQTVQLERHNHRSTKHQPRRAHLQPPHQGRPPLPRPAPHRPLRAEDQHAGSGPSEWSGESSCGDEGVDTAEYRCMIIWRLYDRR